MKKKIILLFILLIMGIIGIISIIKIEFNNKVKIIDTNSNIVEKVKNVSFSYNIDKIEDFEEVGVCLLKRIYDYETYIRYEEMFNLKLNVNENDFNDNFIVIAIFEKDFGLSYYQTRIIKDTLYVELIQNNNKQAIENGICVMLSNSKNKEKIKVSRVVEDFKFENCKPIYEIGDKFTLEDAISDNFLVIDLYNKKTYNMEVWNDFFNNVSLNKSCNVKIYKLSKNGKSIDIDYLKYLSEDKFYLAGGYADDYNNIELSYGINEINTNEILKKEYPKRATKDFIQTESIIYYEINDSNINYSFYMYE